MGPAAVLPEGSPLAGEGGRGVGVCGVFTRDIAETKVSQVTEYSRSHEHPLMCTMEEA